MRGFAPPARGAESGFSGPSPEKILLYIGRVILCSITCGRGALLVTRGDLALRREINHAASFRPHDFHSAVDRRRACFSDSCRAHVLVLHRSPPLWTQTRHLVRLQALNCGCALLAAAARWCLGRKNCCRIAVARWRVRQSIWRNRAPIGSGHSSRAVHSLPRVFDDPRSAATWR